MPQPAHGVKSQIVSASGTGRTISVLQRNCLLARVMQTTQQGDLMPRNEGLPNLTYA